MLEFLKEKGNALKSIFDKEDGHIIDQGTIIRLNSGEIRNTKSQGSYTTALIYSTSGVEKLNWGPVAPIRLRSKFMPTKSLKFHGSTGYKYSTGYCLLQWIHKIGKEKVNIFGFDWKETNTFYNNAGSDSDKHDYTYEKEVIIELCEKNKWIIY